MRDGPASSSFQRPLERAVNLLGVTLVLAELLRIATRGVRLQWDFRVYLEAARAALAGFDPYRVENLIGISGRPIPLPFLYPPAALAPFLALAALQEPAALALWMGLKVLLVTFLVVLWKRVFVPRAGWFTVALVAVFGSNAAALWDLRSGNVALVEAALIWGGLACFVAGRRRAFAALIVLAATFKLAPAAFLLLLLVPTRGARARPGLLAAAVLALGAIVFLPLAAGPAAHWRGFLGGSLGGAFPVGAANPSGFAYLAERLGGVSALVIGCWLGWLLGLGLLSGGTLRALGRAGDARAWSIAAVALYMVAHPRPMAYGWVLAGGALVALIRAGAPTPIARAGLVLLVCGQGLLWALQIASDAPIVVYAPVLFGAGLWLLASLQGAAGILQIGESGALEAKPGG